ncbi:hypothetical protein ACQ4PT_005923 [Festuca glaucescens]
MHNTNSKCTDDVAVARPVENTKECATSLAVAVNKKGSQVHKSLSTDNRDKPPSSSAIAHPQTSGRKKKASKKDKHSTDSAIVPTKGKGDEGSNDRDNPTSSSQVVLYASRVEECAVDTALEETSKGRTKRSLPSKDYEKEALPAKRRRMVKSNNLLPIKDSEAASDKDHLMCQMSIQTIIDAADQLKRIHELIKSVRDAGFGHFIDTKIKGSINRKGMSYILKHIDIPTMTVKFSEGRSFHGENDIPTGTASEHQGTLLIKDSNAVQGDTVNSIKNLMQQVLNLTSNLQTTSQLLNRRIPKDNEDRKIKNLRVQTSSLLSMFELFGEEQKSLLDRYCIDAQSSEMNQVKSIPAANDEHRRCVAKEAHQTVELGVWKATGKQQARIVEEDCKKKSNVMPKKKKKKHKVSNKTDSIRYQQLEEVHPDPEHHTGSLPDILNPGNPHIQESNKELAIQMSGKKDAEANRPELGTSAATITGISAHKLAESLDPKDAETSNVIAEADAPDLETSAATISETHVSDEGTEEENELAPTGDNTADEQEETNVVSCHHDEQKNQKFIQYGDTEVTIGELADSFEDGAPIKTNIMTIMVDVARSIMTNTKRLIVTFMAVLRCNRIQRNNDGNVNTRKLGNLVKAINLVDDSLMLDRYKIIKIPCFEEGDKNDHVGHYFVMFVNLRRKRFELLDSLGGEGAEQHFVNMADVFKEIWKDAYKQSKGKLSPENLDDFTYEKPKVIPLQGATLNCGVYMIMFLLFWTGKSLFHIRQDDILFIRKRLLYLILMWEKLEVNFGLIETFHKDDFIKINSGEYKIIRKQTTVKPTMTVIVSLHDVNIPKPKEIDDGKENYPEEQEYVLISSQEDYNMECLKGRGRGEYDSKKRLDGNCQPEETTKNGKEDRNQQQQKPVVARNNENSSIEYLRAREAKVDDPSRNSKEKGPPKQKVNLVLFTPPNRKSSPPSYKIEKDMYSSLTGSQSFQTPPKDSKSNSVDVEHKDNLNRGKRKLVTPSDVTSTKRPKITARKLCEPVAEYRPKKFKHQVKSNKLFNLIVRSNKFAVTEVFNAPVMHSVVPDMMVPINGTDIKRQFSSGEFLDGGTMDYIIEEMKTTSKLYDTGERVLLSQGFIMHVLQVSIWKQSTEQIKEAAKKRGQTFNYTKDFNLEIALDAFHRYVDKGKSLLDAKLIEAMQYSRRSTGSRTQEPAPANLLVYHRRSARERELADERNRAFREQEVVGGLEQLGECLVRTAIMALPSPNAPPHIRRACRPSMPSMAELPRRVDGLHPREARNQHICAGEYPPLEHLERALEGQYLHALIPPDMEKEVTASIVLCKVKRAMKRWLIRGIDASLTPLDSAAVSAFVPCRVIGRNNKHWVGANGEWVAFVQDQAQWTLLNVYTKAEITLPSIRNVGIHPDDHFRYHCEMASLVLLKIQITGEPFLVEGKWHYCAIEVFDKTIAIMMGGRDSD